MAFDDETVFVGSMNLDQRSRWLNTEDGLVVHSSELAHETLKRFDAMTEPQNAYGVKLDPGPQGRKRLLWSTEEDGHPVTYSREPARSLWQRSEVRVLTWVVPEREL